MLESIILYEARGWRARGITLQMLHDEKQPKVAISPEIDEYYQKLYVLLQENADLFPAETPSHH